MAINIAKLGRKKGADPKLDAVEQILHDNAAAFIKAVEANLAKTTTDKPKGTNATGSLTASIAPEIKVFGFRYKLVINAEDYWWYVDQGRKAGKFPPLSAIAKWVTAKALKPDIAKMKLKIPKKGRTPAFERNARNAQIFLIGRAIKTRGIKGNRFATKEIPDFMDDLERELSLALGRDIEAHLAGVITKQGPAK